MAQAGTFRIAWRNLGRNRRRTLLALAAICLGQTTLVSVNGMMAGMFRNILAAITGPLVGHVQVHHPEWREQRALDQCIGDLTATLADIERIPGVRRACARVYSAALAASGERTDEPADAEAALLVGVDVESESRAGGLLEGIGKGRLPGQGAVVVGAVLARRLGVTAGDLLAVIGQDAYDFPANDLFRVKAVVRGSVDMVNRMGVVMSRADASTFLAISDQAHEIVIRGENAQEAEALASRLRRLPRLAGAQVLAWREAVPQLATLIDVKWVMDLVFVGILFVAAAAGIANTMMMSTFERTHEFGMLLALGCRPGRIVRMILVESVLLGAVGVAVGSLLGAVIVVVTGHTGIDYSALAGVKAEDVAYQGLSFSYVIYPKLEMIHVLQGFVAVTVTSVLASLWPAALAARLAPVEAMRS